MGVSGVCFSFMSITVSIPAIPGIRGSRWVCRRASGQPFRPSSLRSSLPYLLALALQFREVRKIERETLERLEKRN